jgi:hypothetical protein
MKTPVNAFQFNMGSLPNILKTSHHPSCFNGIRFLIRKPLDNSIISVDCTAFIKYQKKVEKVYIANSGVVGLEKILTSDENHMWNAPATLYWRLDWSAIPKEYFNQEYELLILFT